MTASVSISGFPGPQTTALGAMIRASALVLLSIGIGESATASTYDTAITSDRTNAGPSPQIAVLPATDSETTASAILEIRRLSGLTWEELAVVFGVSRRSVHHWASGKTVSSSHDQDIRRVLVIVRRLDRGDAALTRNLLLSPDVAGQAIFHQLKAGSFEQAMARAGATPRYARAQLTPLSAEAQRRRRPLSPVLLVEAQQHQPEIRTNALPKRFARPPKAES